MPRAHYRVSPDQLDKLAKDWHAESAKLHQVEQQVHSLLGKFRTAEINALLTKGVIALEVLLAAQEETEEAGTNAGKVAKAVEQDAANIATVAKNYREAEEAAKRLHRPGHHPQPGHHPKPQPHPQPHPGGNGNNPPATRPNSAGKINVSEVQFNGAGSWKSGEAACKEYIDEALDKMGITDPTARANWERGMLTIAKRESGYNSPLYQVNKTDSNAIGATQSDGAPAQSSRGGWQCIPSTFAAYHQAGTSNNIYDPVANVAASMNYIMNSHYHVSPDGHDLASKIQQADPSRPPRGY